MSDASSSNANEPPVLESVKPSEQHLFLMGEFQKEITKQPDRLDEFAKVLFKMELAIPGAYAALLKIFLERGALPQPQILTAAILFWGVALAITLWGISPRKYEVLEDVPSREPKMAHSPRLSVEEYYRKVGSFKLKTLRWAAGFFFIGIGLAAWAVLK